MSFRSFDISPGLLLNDVERAAHGRHLSWAWLLGRSSGMVMRELEAKCFAGAVWQSSIYARKQRKPGA